MLHPIDRGWAWVMALGGMVVFVVVRGMSNVMGLFVIEMVRQFNATSSQVALIFAARDAVDSISALFTLGVINDVIHARVQIMLGGLFFSLGFILCYFAKTIHHIFCYSIFIGIGNALTWCQVLVVVNQYFDKHRTLATGIVSSGNGFGTITLPFLIKHLIDEYSLRGTFLIIGGVCLHIIASAALMRPPEFYHRGRNDDVTSLRLTSDPGKVTPTIAKVTSGVAKLTSDTGSPVRRKLSDGGKNYSFNSNISDGKVHVIVENVSRPLHNSPHSVNVPTREVIASDKAMETLPIKSSVVDSSGLSGNTNNVTVITQCEHSEGNIQIVHSSTISDKSSVLKDNINLQSQQNCNEFTLHTIHDNECTKRTFKSKISNFFFRSRSKRKRVQVIDFELLKNPAFMSYQVGASLFFACIGIEAVFRSPLAGETIGNLRDISILISIYGAMNWLSRYVQGFLGDSGLVPRYKIALLCCGSLGVVCNIARLFVGFWPHVAYHTMAGFGIGSYLALHPVIVIDFFGRDVHARSMGITVLMSGVFKFSMAPAVGYIHDVTGSYAASFTLIGCTYLVGCTIWVFVTIPLLKRQKMATQTVEVREMDDADVKTDTK